MHTPISSFRIGDNVHSLLKSAAAQSSWHKGRWIAGRQTIYSSRKELAGRMYVHHYPRRQSIKVSRNSINYGQPLEEGLESFVIHAAAKPAAIAPTPHTPEVPSAIHIPSLILLVPIIRPSANTREEE